MLWLGSAWLFSAHLLFIPGKPLNQVAPPPLPILSQSEAKNPRINQLSAHWQQVWLLALERQRKLNDALDRLEEVRILFWTWDGQEMVTRFEGWG